MRSKNTYYIIHLSSRVIYPQRTNNMPRRKKKSLFDDDGDKEDSFDLKINKDYSKRYEERKKAEELSRCKQGVEVFHVLSNT